MGTRQAGGQGESCWRIARACLASLWPLLIGLREHLFRVLRLVFLSLLAGLSACGSWESVPDPTPDALDNFAAPKRLTKLSGDSVVRAFEEETGRTSDYLLGDGDDIYLEVVGRPELSGAHHIGPDGRITLSVAGPVMVRGSTRQAAANAVAMALAPYYRNVYATVRVDKYNSNRIIVIGNVEKPGVLPFETPPSLLEVLAQVGGQKQQVPTRCSVIRGERILWLDLKRLITGDASLNIRLQRDDVVYVPDSNETSVFVLGEVKAPGIYRYSPPMSLMNVLAQAGGPTTDANIDEIHLIRPGKQQNLSLSVEELLGAEHPTRNVAIEEGDVLYVPRNGVFKVGYIIRHVNPFAYLLLISTFAVP